MQAAVVEGGDRAVGEFGHDQVAAQQMDGEGTAARTTVGPARWACRVEFGLRADGVPEEFERPGEIGLGRAHAATVGALGAVCSQVPARTQPTDRRRRSTATVS